MKIRILTEKEIRDTISFDHESIKAIQDGFSQLSSGNATLPPIMRIDIPENNGEVDVKTAYIKGLDQFAIKIAAGFFDNYKLNLPTGSGIMLIVSARTGNVEAILLDNGYLTDLRTGIAGAIASKYLACKNITTAGVIGSGMQARYQIYGLKQVRDFNRLLVFGIVSKEVDNYVNEIKKDLNIEVIKCDTAEVVVKNSDVVITTTPSKKPFLRSEWLHPGLHITCMGADAPHKNEIYPEVFGIVDKIACDSRKQCFELGELHHAKNNEILLDNKRICELGELINGKYPSRESGEEITICDLTGVGVQDTQIALLAHSRSLKNHSGIVIDS